MSTNTQTLQELLAERVTLFANSGKAQEIIDAGVEKLFKDVVEDAFRSYGDMGKAVKEAVKAAMPANISDMFELTRYNALIANTLREKWASSGVQADMIRRANEAIDEVLKDEVIPDRVSLRELLELFVEENKEEAVRNQWERPEVRIRESDYGGFHIFFDPVPESEHRRGLYAKDRHDYSLKHNIHVACGGREPELDGKGNNVGRVYSAQLDDKPIGRDFSIHNRWERLIAALYFGAAKLVIDCHEDDFSYGLYD